MVTLEFESFVCAGVDSSVIGQHVRKWVDLSKDRSVCHDLLLNVVDFLREAEVHDLIEVVSRTALIVGEMLVGALLCRTSLQETCLWQEALSLTPCQHLVNRAALAAAILVAVHKLLARESDGLLLTKLADAVLSR